jgi:DNA modification methylase
MTDLDAILAAGGPWKRAVRIGGQLLIEGDCREVMAVLPKVDACLTDPPYGIGFAAQPTTGQRRLGMAPRSWDDQTLTEVLDLPEKAESCMIWGGNYYGLPPSRGWLSWFKPDAPPSMGSLELCWTSRDANARQFNWSIAATNAERVGHPTQKPVALMEWCLGFLPDARTILDPFAGSGTVAVACQRLGRQSISIELDPGYFDTACRRVQQVVDNPPLFTPEPPKPQQESMSL